MCGMSLRLQGPTTLSADSVQALDKAVDLKDLGAVSVRVTVASVSTPAPNGFLVLEDAAVLEAAAFQPVRGFSLDAARVTDAQLVGLQRYLRWRFRDNSAGSVTFYIDLTARC